MMNNYDINQPPVVVLNEIFFLQWRAVVNEKSSRCTRASLAVPIIKLALKNKYIYILSQMFDGQQCDQSREYIHQQF